MVTAKDQSPALICIEVGGGSVQTIVFDAQGDFRILEGAHRPNGARLAMAIPGLIAGHRVVAASNLGWVDVDPVEALGLSGSADVVTNDAEAAALGETALRPPVEPEDLTYLSLGTGVGGAVVKGGLVVAGNLFGHAGGFGSRRCRCGRTGCLETVAGGWALPFPIADPTLEEVARSVTKAIEDEPLAAGLVVIGGGIARRYPWIIDQIKRFLPGRVVEPSAAPPHAKSAAAWGLQKLAEKDGNVRTEPSGIVRGSSTDR